MSDKSLEKELSSGPVKGEDRIIMKIHKLYYSEETPEIEINTILLKYFPILKTGGIFEKYIKDMPTILKSDPLVKKMINELGLKKKGVNKGDIIIFRRDYEEANNLYARVIA